MALQKRLLERNGYSMSNAGEMQRPDGDVELDQALIDSFKVADCISCDGLLKPSVVFFGGSVPKAVTEESRKLVRDCDSILAIGTTLSTYSAFRLFRDAAQDRKPIAILTDGPTRADELADLKFEARCSEMLVEVEAVLA